MTTAKPSRLKIFLSFPHERHLPRNATDEFRTGIDAVIAQFAYVQPAPDGVLAGVENGGYTNTDVTFTWTDEAIVTIKKDGEIIEYVSGKKLTENGAYEITFENFDGYKAIYPFIIDKTAPELNVEGVENGSATNTDVIRCRSRKRFDCPALQRRPNLSGAMRAARLLRKKAATALRRLTLRGMLRKYPLQSTRR